MAGPALPENIDSTYADDGADASVQIHQSHHDAIHDIVNKFDKDTSPSTGWGWLYDSATGVYVPSPPSNPVSYATLQTITVDETWGGKVHRFRATSGNNVITLPTIAQYDAPLGFSFGVIHWDVSSVTIAPASDGSLLAYSLGSGTRTLAGQYAFATVTKMVTAGNIWMITGQIA